MTRLRAPVAPRLPDPPPAYAQRHLDALLSLLRLYFNQLDNLNASSTGQLDALNTTTAELTEDVQELFDKFANGGPFDFIDFVKTASFTRQEARIGWNAADQTLDLGMAYNVTQQVGMEVYARVENNTGVDIPNGTVVGFAGVGPNNVLSVAPYLANGTQPSLYILGVMTHLLPDSGSVGYCTTWGHVRGLDTTGVPVGETWSVGDLLYANPITAGAFTNVKPTAPNNVIPVAAVLSADATEGEIFVRPTIEQMRYYGIFVKSTDQSPAASNTEYLLTFDSAQITNGVTVGTPASRIIVPQSGLYQFDTTIQVTSGNSSAKTVWFWFKKNGVTVPNSARLVTVTGNGVYTPVSLSEFFSLAVSDYVEIAFAADDTAITVDAVAATAFAPAAPAVLLAVTQVQQ